MKGLELSEAYYREVGRPAIEEKLPDALPYLAAGLAGEGSECLGYDDEFSRDHDFGPSYCLWLSDPDYERFGAALTELYRSQPGSFRGFSARVEQIHGGGRVGVLRSSDFFRKFTGLPDLPQDNLYWLRLPEHFLRQVVNGKVFEDNPGDFTRIRQGYQAFYPEEVRKKKLAARAVTMAQAGQYNYPRALQRGDAGAAFLALSEFVKAAISMAHLLSRVYTPYYKWMFRSVEELPLFADAAASLEFMIRQPLSEINPDRIEQFCVRVVEVWQQQGLTTKNESFLDPQGWELYRQIRSEKLRKLPIQEG